MCVRPRFGAQRDTASVCKPDSCPSLTWRHAHISSSASRPEQPRIPRAGARRQAEARRSDAAGACRCFSRVWIALTARTRVCMRVADSTCAAAPAHACTHWLGCLAEFGCPLCARKHPSAGESVWRAWARAQRCRQSQGHSWAQLVGTHVKAGQFRAVRWTCVSLRLFPGKGPQAADTAVAVERVAFGKTGGSQQQCRQHRPDGWAASAGGESVAHGSSGSVPS